MSFEAAEILDLTVLGSIRGTSTPTVFAAAHALSIKTAPTLVATEMRSAQETTLTKNNDTQEKE